MTQHRMRVVVESMKQKMVVRGMIPARYNSNDQAFDDVRGQVEHALWMCDEVRIFIDTGRTAKAMRWMGFIQAVMWCSGYYTIEELKVMNKEVITDAGRD